MKIAIACFVKTPRLSPVKTRLTAGVGAAEAKRIYLGCVEVMRASLRQSALTLTTLIPHWCVAEKAAATDVMWSDFATLVQHGNGLGERLSKAFETLMRNHDAVILIGADCPFLSPTLLVQTATQIAESKGYVLGPTDDGGYYLFGSRHPVSKNAWLETPYSSPETAKTFVQWLEQDRPVSILPARHDIDDKSDWERALVFLRAAEDDWSKFVLTQIDTV